MIEKRITLTRPLFVKGRGLPKNGICLAREGQEVTVRTDNGTQWYIATSYRGKPIRIATIPSTL